MGLTEETVAQCGGKDARFVGDCTIPRHLYFVYLNTLLSMSSTLV